jgi:hypothetical protein
MDINKYIGLYLVKNGYCSLPSLGTLSLEKIGAKKLDGNNIDSPKYNITFNAVGSIDDKFPYFIAMNENISTNNATNAISVFGKEVKEEIAKGTPYIIDGLGRFTNSGGKISFQQQSDFDLSEFMVAMPEPMQPIIDNNRVAQTEKDNAAVNVDFKSVVTAQIKESNFNIGKVLLPIGLLAVIGVGGYFGYTYLKKQQSTNTSSNAIVIDSTINSTPVVPVVDTTAKTNVDTTIATPAAVDTNKPAVVQNPVANGPAIKVAILTYKSETEAAAKSKKLSAYGNNTSVVKVDSVTYQVVLSLANTNRSAELVVDSLRKFFNPSEKMGKVVVVK